MAVFQTAICGAISIDNRTHTLFQGGVTNFSYNTVGGVGSRRHPSHPQQKSQKKHEPSRSATTHELATFMTSTTTPPSATNSSDSPARTAPGSSSASPAPHQVLNYFFSQVFFENIFPPPSKTHPKKCLCLTLSTKTETRSK